MFIGHFAVAFAAKRPAPRVSLGMLFIAAQFLDLLWPTLLLLGVERVRIEPGITPVVPLAFEHYPISHSLVAVLVWGAVVGGLYRWIRGSTRGAVVIALAVISHWFLDLVVHVPDLPLAPGADLRVGFGLWRSLGATLAVELVIYALGVWLYVRTTRAVDRTGRWVLVSLVAALLLIHLGNVFGRPPTSVTAIAWFAQAQWLLVIWAFWVDRHRVARPKPRMDTVTPTK